MDSIELYELIDSSRIKLKRNNLEYKNLYEQFHKIMNAYPNLQLILEDKEPLELNKEECKMLQKLNSLYMQMYDIVPIYAFESTIIIPPYFKLCY